MLIKGSFEDFLYILVGLIWLAFSVYKGVKKKKPQPSSKEESSKRKSALETMMEQFMVEEPETIVYETPSPDPVPQTDTDEKIFSYDDIYEESNQLETSAVYDRRPEPEKKVVTKPESTRKKKKIRRFDVRKAVIYSEILNRRYF